MYRPAEDQMERMAGYAMQRNAVQEMGMMLRMEEERILMMQMQEMEIMQMQAMGGMPFNRNEVWGFPQQQQQQQVLMEQEPLSHPPHQRDTDSHWNAHGLATARFTAPGVAAQQEEASTYAPNSLYNTTPSTNAAEDLSAAQDSTYNRNSMYGGNINAYAAASGSDLNANNVTAAAYSMYDASKATSMYEKPAPSSGAANSEAAKTASVTGTPSSGNSSNASPRRNGVSPAVQRTPSVSTPEKRESSLNLKEKGTTTTSSKYQTRAIRQRNSELKRQNSWASTKGGSRNATSQPAPGADRRRSISQSSNGRRDSVLTPCLSAK
ncbi:hypothetical protein JKF63_03937 [Porcisia hertigi]|uniref:Uncharacterized protein n=1 Tax=Porcisia hertigi TaxID=2761500 RepID=A0A836HR80_9TRYP|nr:hypothetical protein JKF63_03937 [Porcisia hertigi]